MNHNEFLAYLGTDAVRWAEQFRRIHKEMVAQNGADPLDTVAADDGWLVGWFANALEAGRRAAVADR